MIVSNLTVIGLHGKPRSGKDTVANYLIKKLNLKRYGPSVRVKDTTAAMFNIPRNYLDDDAKKDEYDPFWKMTYREMAQKVGKESSRDVFGDNFWMQHVGRELLVIEEINKLFPGGCNGIVLADIRYASEIQWIEENTNGIVAYIIRDDLPESSGKGHPAENGLPIELADIVINNNGTIDDLYKQVDREFLLNNEKPKSLQNNWKNLF